MVSAVRKIGAPQVNNTNGKFGLTGTFYARDFWGVKVEL